MSGPAYENVICDVCGERFDRRILDNYTRKINYCSQTCRNQFYHDRDNRRMIQKAIEENNLKRLGGFTVRMLLRLGFRVEVKSPL